jgi:hypothetical protein
MVAALVPAPDWVSFQAEKTIGLDLLGLRAPVQRIGNDLLDGVTTVTPKVRYLSVLAWATWRFSRSGLPDSTSSFTSFLNAQEAMIVLSNREKSRSVVGLVGRDAADRLLDTGEAELPLERLAQQISYNLYLTASRQLNLTHEDYKTFSGLTQERGLELAKAFDEAIKGTRYGKSLSRDPTKSKITRREMKELSETVFLDDIPTRERDILLDAIIPTRPEPGELSRLANYALLLWLVRQNGSVSEGSVFAAAEDLPEGLPKQLEGTLNGWLEYLTRDVLAVTHECVLAAILSQVDAAHAQRGSPPPAGGVIATLVADEEEHNDALRSIGLLKSRETVAEVSFATLRARIKRICSRDCTVSGGLRRWKEGLRETEIYETALRAGVGAVALLPAVWCLVTERIALEKQGDTPMRRLLSLGGPYQIGIEDVVMPKIDELERRGATLKQAMAELALRTAQQHLRVAWTRFSPPNGKDVSVLIADSNTWARGNNFSAGRTDSRLSIAISWLRQLGLIDDRGVTSVGRSTLRKSLQQLGGKRS